MIRFSGGVTTIAQPSFWTGSTAIWKPRINLNINSCICISFCPYNCTTLKCIFTSSSTSYVRKVIVIDKSVINGCVTSNLACIYIGSGEGEATKTGEAFLKSLDGMTFSQSTVGKATRKALETASTSSN